jgi:hypothetical protein
MKIPISDYCRDLRFLSFRVSGLRGAKLWKRSILPLLFFLAAPLVAQQKPLVEISGYTIDAQLSPADHKLSATASVTFTVLDNSDNAIFELHGALKVEKVTDTTGKALTGERGPNATVIVTPASPLVKGQQYTWVFTYDGALQDETGSPVEGLKLAYVGDPISYLLYPGRWFPMSGFLTDRFTADIHVKVPAGYRVIGSGATTSLPASLPHQWRPRQTSISIQLRRTNSSRRITVRPRSANLPTSPAPSACLIPRN